MKTNSTLVTEDQMKRMKKAVRRLTVRRFIDETRRLAAAMPADQQSGMTDLVAWLQAHPHNIYVGRRLPRRTSRRRIAA